MGENFLENKIHDELFNFESLIDNEKLWKDIQRKQNKNNRFIYLSSFVGFALISLSSYLVAGSMNAETTTEFYKVDHNKHILNQENKNITSHQVVDHTDKEYTSKTNPSEVKEKINIEDKSQESLNLTTEQTEEKSKTALTSHQQKNTLSSIKLSTKKQKNNTSLSESNTLNIISYSNKPLTSSNNLIETKPVVVTLKNDLAIMASETKPQFNLTTSNFKRETLNLSAIERYNDLLNFDSDHYLLPKNKSKIKCFDHKRRYNPFSILGYTGPGYVLRTLSNRSGTGETDDYIQARKDNEKVLESIRTGVLLKFKSKSGLYFKTGIDYDRITEKLDFSTSSDTSYILPNQVIKIEIASNGDSIVTYGPVEVTEMKTKTWINYNKYEFFSIPLMVGFEKSRNKWSYAAELGVMINAAFSFTGKVLDSDVLPIDQPNYFKSNTGLSLTGGVGMGYQIAPNFKLWGIPSFRYHLNSVNVDSYPIEQKYMNVNLLFGVEWKF